MERFVWFYNEEGALTKIDTNGQYNHITILEKVKDIGCTSPTLNTPTLEVQAYRKYNKSGFIAGKDERDRLSVLNNLYLDVHVSWEFHRSECVNRRVDVEAMLSNRLIHQLIDNLQHKITFTTRPSYRSNYIEMTASI